MRKSRGDMAVGAAAFLLFVGLMVLGYGYPQALGMVPAEQEEGGHGG